MRQLELMILCKPWIWSSLKAVEILYWRGCITVDVSCYVTCNYFPFFNTKILCQVKSFLLVWHIDIKFSHIAISFRNFIVLKMYIFRVLYFFSQHDRLHKYIIICVARLSLIRPDLLIFNCLCMCSLSRGITATINYVITTMSDTRGRYRLL